jgi:hypothetical protein
MKKIQLDASLVRGTVNDYRALKNFMVQRAAVHFSARFTLPRYALGDAKRLLKRR